MGLSVRDQERIIHKFFEEFVGSTQKFREYISGAAIGEDSTGQFLSVYLKKALPANLQLPFNYEGLKVYLEIVGEIEPLGSD